MPAERSAAAGAGGGAGCAARCRALEVDDDAVRVVERVDAVPAAAFEVEHDAGAAVRAARRRGRAARRRPRTAARRPCSASTARVFGRSTNTRSGPCDALAVIRHFAIELERHAQRVGQHLAPDARSGHRRRAVACGRPAGARRGPACARAPVAAWAGAGRRPARRRARAATACLRVASCRKRRRERREQPQRAIAVQLVAELAERDRPTGTAPCHSALSAWPRRGEQAGQILERADERADAALRRGGGARLRRRQLAAQRGLARAPPP